MATILESGGTDGIICSIGMPVHYRDSLYNCLVMVFNSRILYIRPKMVLVDDTNYRETRWFKNWEGWTTMETMTLPPEV